MQFSTLRTSLCAASALLVTTLATAGELSALQALAQNEFRGLSEDMGAALSYKGLIPAEPLGITGFDIGVATSWISLDNKGYWSKAGSNVTQTALVPSLRAHKGLPFNLDLGVMYSQVPRTGINLMGGEVRWAVFEGGTVAPAVALRLGATRLSGLDQLDFNTSSLDVSISKGFLMLTPYAGIGTVRTNSKPHVTGVSLRSESFNQSKVFVGTNLNFGLMNFAIEGDKTGDISTTSLKLGLRF